MVRPRFDKLFFLTTLGSEITLLLHFGCLLSSSSSDCNLLLSSPLCHLQCGPYESHPDRVAYAACTCLVLETLSLPLVIRSMTYATSAKIRALSYLGWNIGANDVANGMGTSEDFVALSLLLEVAIASVLEFFGALSMGTHVTSTMHKRVLVASVFQGKNSLLFAGLLSSIGYFRYFVAVGYPYIWMVEFINGLALPLQSRTRRWHNLKNLLSLFHPLKLRASTPLLSTKIIDNAIEKHSFFCIPNPSSFEPKDQNDNAAVAFQNQTSPDPQHTSLAPSFDITPTLCGEKQIIFIHFFFFQSKNY
ncbi:Inorganic phosphate transporter 2-1, chloroplastic [Dendrobium catenatum]|uniref:Inorganic phosphate transporter 2-1, chloroplastic n=1 Tax=Dendrobium catenatum TaxID=906689 RepID=A0A2I0WGB2_9ASPA|nr:Inorganic phosphate transporter 2-1, chloroplastic [Dendrobium catenatum]